MSRFFSSRHTSFLSSLFRVFFSPFVSVSPLPVLHFLCLHFFPSLFRRSSFSSLRVSFLLLSPLMYQWVRSLFPLTPEAFSFFSSCSIRLHFLLLVTRSQIRFRAERLHASLHLSLLPLPFSISLFLPSKRAHRSLSFHTGVLVFSHPTFHRCTECLFFIMTSQEVLGSSSPYLLVHTLMKRWRSTRLHV